MPNSRNSGSFHPVTTLRMKRPPEMWSMVAACFAAITGWTVGTCEVAKMPELRFTPAMPAAQE